jgi:CubicO group peptidase (beta-lactamase class C family)
MNIDTKQVQAFEQYLERFMAEQKAPGMTVAVAQGDELIYSKAFGYSDEANRVTATPHTIFGIASITKSFTAVAVAQLAEQGKLSFDDPVVKHLPNFKLPESENTGEPITLHHLLTHTTGIPPLPTLGYSIRGNTVPDPREDGRKPEVNVDEPRMNTVEDLLRFMADMDHKTFGKPGEYFSYSNDCYGLLGRIISVVSGVPYQQYIRDNILIPLGMSRTLFSYEELTEYEDVTELYYKNDDDEVRHSHKWQVAPPFMAGGWLKSCALDLIKFFQMYSNGGTYGNQRIVGEESVKSNISRSHRFSLYDSYGHGLRVRPDYHGVTLVEHGGSLKGVSSNAGFVPEKRLSAVVLCNLTGVPVGKAWLAAINMALGLPVETPRNNYEPRKWMPGVIGRYVGVYKSGEGAELEIVEEREELLVKIKKDSSVLHCLNETTGLMVFKGQEQEIRFYRDRNGKAWGIGHGVRIIPRA